jgi:fructokinase
MLLSCGDALIDFLPVKSAEGRDAVVPMVGGSCFNTAIGMARLGAPTGFVGGISTDLFGRMIADHATDSGVDLRFATRSEHQTTLAFVRTVAGDPQYAFYDEQSASRNWSYRQGSIPFAEVEAIHVGSTTLVDEAGAAQVLAMIQDARGSTAISFDPNCRPNFVKHKGRYLDCMDAFARMADIIRMSDTDFGYLYGDEDCSSNAQSLIEAGVSLFVITRGSQGARAWHREAGALEIEAPKVKIADTIGAGDSFQAALLFALRAIGRIRPSSLARATADELRGVLSFASLCAAFTCGRAGADPPRRSDVSTDLIAGLVQATA